MYSKETWKEKCSDHREAVCAWILVLVALTVMNAVLTFAVPRVCQRGLPAPVIAEAIVSHVPAPAPVQAALRGVVLLNALTIRPRCK
jgi:hypothetical protein